MPRSLAGGRVAVGRLPYAASFDGTSSCYIASSSGASNAVWPGASATVALWVFLRGQVPKGGILGLINKRSSTGWLLELYNNNNTMQVAWQVGSSGLWTPSYPFPSNVWWHLGITHQDTGGGTGTATLYVDGLQVAQTTGLANPANDAVNCGLGARQSDGWFIGQLADARVYNQALSANQMKALQLHGHSGLEIPSVQALRWGCQDSAGPIVDLSGNGFAGTLNGTAALRAAGPCPARNAVS